MFQITADTLFQLNTWFFLAQGTDVSASTQYGFRYMLEGSSALTPTTVFKIRSPSTGTFHALTSAASIIWTNDVFQSHCNCKMRYVRLYTDFVPYNEDMMISLALMDDPNSKISLI